ncbi:hypothetical protein LTR17_018993 [Elasticomyces elasticus]|nr:hypothetical protein LTR17_018993 [Elasticomyces elasticus]
MSDSKEPIVQEIRSDHDIGRSAGYGTGSEKSSQKLDRYLSLKPAVAFAMTVLSSWTGISLTMSAAFLNGGPTTLVWGTLLAGVGSLAIAASLGELASISSTPVVGAQYQWTGLYAPRAMSPAFWSLLQGWLTVFSWICLCAAVPFISALCLQGLIILNDETYVPQRWQATLLMWAFLALPVLGNVYGRKLLKAVEIMGGVLHIVFFVVTITTLAVMARRSTAKFVFTESFFGQSGWESEGVQWSLGLLSITSVLTGAAATSPKLQKNTIADSKVPIAMMLAVVFNTILALAFLITVLFCIGDVEAAVGTTTGFPIIQILYQATESKAAATVIVCMILFSTMIALFGVFASVSRLTWAFARDNGLPYSGFFSRVHPTLHIPLNALGLVTLIAALLGLINIGNTTAFNAILSLATMGLYLSYVMPLAFVLIRKLQGRHPNYGPFRLGIWSIPVNIVGLAFGIYMVIFLPFPSVLPVTGATMNYAAPILGFIMLVALGDWFVSGRKRFEVPTHAPEHYE